MHRYHQTNYRHNYDQIITERTVSILSTDNLRLLQDTMLKKIHHRGIAIEIPLTSNVRISFYTNHREHHLWRWLGIDRDSSGDIPSIVIGTDDPGIFATNIRNEYCHIFYQAVYKFGLDRQLAAGIVKKLEENAKVYRFDSDSGSYRRLS